MWQSKRDETRKVQFTGGSTYIVSLPRRWIAQNQLRKGSFVVFREQEGGLLTIIPPGISAIQKRSDEATIKVSIQDETEKVKRKIVSVYLAGYNTIQIKADKQTVPVRQRQEIKNFVRHMLVGTEIVTDTPTQVVLQVLLSFPELTVQSALRRMSIITTSMHNDAVECLKTSDKGLAKEVLATDNEVDRFNLYVTRLLKTTTDNPQLVKEAGIIRTDNCSGYRLVTKYIERAADHAVRIAENSMLLKKTVNNESVQQIEKLSSNAINMFGIAMESLFRQDYNSAEKIIEDIGEFRKLEKEAILSSSWNADDGPILRLIIESINRTAEYACDIAEIVLNLTIESTLV